MANFALNDRIWKPEAQFINENRSLHPSRVPIQFRTTPNLLYLPILDSELSAKQNNAGLGFFHENRCKGKALFAIDTETLNRDGNIMAGINTRQYTPFNVRMAYDVGPNTNRFNGVAEMYTFFYYDKVIRLKNGDISVTGK